jgi:hypothetical protein
VARGHAIYERNGSQARQGCTRCLPNTVLLHREALALHGFLQARVRRTSGDVFRAVPGRRGDIGSNPKARVQRVLRDTGGHRLSDDASVYLDRHHHHQPTVLPGPGVPAEVISEAHTVVYLLRLNFLGSAKRKPFWDAHPPTHLLTITPRPSFVNGGSDSCEYGWFCWDRGGRVLTDRRFITL